jgi:hypothetical protein
MGVMPISPTRRQVGFAVVLDGGVVKPGDGHLAARAQQQGVAVGIGADDFLRAYGAAGAADVFNHDGRAQALGQRLGDDARNQVHAAACRVTHHQRDRLGRWPALGLRCTEGQQSQQGGRGPAQRAGQAGAGKGGMWGHDDGLLV